MLSIKEFKDLWEADTSRGKEEVTKQLSFIWYMSWWKSPYIGYDEKVREQKVKIDILGSKDYPLSPVLIIALRKYNELLLNASPSLGFLRDAQEAVQKIRDFFRTVNLKADEKGVKMTTLLRSLSAADGIIKGLAALEAKVEQETVTVGRVRGGGTVGMREEPRERRKY